MLNAHLIKQIMGRIFNLLVRKVNGIDFSDTQCGFKMLSGAIADELFGKSTVNRFAIDVEILHLARAEGYRIYEEPIRCVNSPKSSVRLVIDSLIMLKDIVTIRLRGNK